MTCRTFTTTLSCPRKTKKSNQGRRPWTLLKNLYLQAPKHPFLTMRLDCFLRLSARVIRKRPPEL